MIYICDFKPHKEWRFEVGNNRDKLADFVFAGWPTVDVVTVTEAAFDCRDGLLVRGPAAGVKITRESRQ